MMKKMNKKIKNQRIKLLRDVRVFNNKIKMKKIKKNNHHNRKKFQTLKK